MTVQEALNEQVSRIARMRRAALDLCIARYNTHGDPLGRLLRLQPTELEGIFELHLEHEDVDGGVVAEGNVEYCLGYVHSRLDTDWPG